MAAFVESALALAARGMRVFPVWGKTDHGCACGTRCASPCKHPLGALVRNGLSDATTDPAVITSWWSERPGANVGLVAGPESGFWMLDIDGPEGQASIDKLVAENGALPPTLEVKTGKGRHLYFSFIEGLKNNTKVLPGLDIRTAGGYVVAPPSVHASGRVYEFVDPEAKVYPAPLWLLDAVREKHKVRLPPTPLRATMLAAGTDRYGTAALRGICDELAQVQKGGRDDTRNACCFRLGRLVAGGHITREDAIYGALDACMKNGLVGDEPQEAVMRRIESGVNDGIAAGPAGPAPEPQRPMAREAPKEERNGAPPPPAAPPPRSTKIPESVPEPPPEDEHDTDIGNGRRLVRLFGQDIRSVPAVGWLLWDGRRWERDTTKKIEHLAKTSVLKMYEELPFLHGKDKDELYAHAKKSEKADRVSGAIRMAASEPSILARSHQFDQDPLSLNVMNGTVNLRSGDLRPHSRSDLITHVAPVDFDPNAECPTWDAFLRRIYADREEVVKYIQRAFGYTITGLTSEQVFFLMYGVGANGKSTALRAFRNVLGDGYARIAPFSTFLASNGPQQGDARPDLARLMGARFVMASEPDEGARFSESVVKSITGGDVVTARMLYQNDAIEFVPVLKLWLAANHRPNVRDSSHAMWRRIQAIPHDVVIDKKDWDKNLDAKLAAEAPGILNWAIRGCLEWQVFGLEVPEPITEAVEAYREEQDVLARFLEEVVEHIPGTDTKARPMYAAYAKWAKDYGYSPWTETTFGKKLREKGLPKKRTEDGMVYIGLRCKLQGM